MGSDADRSRTPGQHDRASASGDVELHDFAAIYDHRVRLISRGASYLIIVLGLAWLVYFALRGDHVLTLIEVGVVAVGATSVVLSFGANRLAAVLLLAGAMFTAIVTSALCLDIPDAAAPRSSHLYLIAMAVGAHLMLVDQPRWLRHGLPFLFAAAAVALASTNFGIHTAWSLPDDVRVKGTWFNACGALAAIYYLVQLFMNDFRRMERELHLTSKRATDRADELAIINACLLYTSPSPRD